MRYITIFLMISMRVVPTGHALSRPPPAKGAEGERPFIWVTDADRAAVLEKIETQPWAASVFEKMKAGVDFYVEQHVVDPAWILSRLPMTWSGPNYTDVRMENGTFVYSGNAPHPSFRFMEGRMPRSPDGKAVVVPALEEIPPFNHHPRGGMAMRLKGTARSCRVEYPDRYIRDMTRPILIMAVDSSVLYWITGEEKYAQFSADILSLLCEGLYYRNSNPDEATNWGLISDNHLLEVRWLSSQLPMIYDFIEPYIRQGGWVYDVVKKEDRPMNREHVQGVFKKYAQLTLDRGILDCNWVVFEACSLVNNALGIDDPVERDRYLDYFFTRDTEHQQSAATFMPWFTEDAFWPESLGYGQGSISFLSYLFSVTDLYAPDRELLNEYPVLFEAVQVLPRYRFPNGESIRFGDSWRTIAEEPYSLELMYCLAEKYGKEDARRRLAGAIRRLIAEGVYDRAAYEPQRYVYYRPLKLLRFSAELKGELLPVDLPRTDSLAHAGLVLQRNAEDAASGMMCWQGGAHHVHAHATGMHMELYGAGDVVGAEAGKGDYSSKLHQQYYRLYAAHNTVIVNNASRGQGGWIDIGQDTVQRVAAEPAPHGTAVSPECSFVATAFTNRYGADAQPAEQQRTMALIRTTPSTGYYVDVYRSRAEGEEQFHDYLYHNIGNDMQLLGDFVRQPAPDWFGRDIGDVYRQPGTHWFNPQYSTGATTNAISATFEMKLKLGMAQTHVWFPAGTEREYVSVWAPPTLESPRPYDRIKTPVVVARRRGEAWNHPFAAVYEVCKKEPGASVRNVAVLPSETGLAVLRIESKTPNGTEVQTVFSADRQDAAFNHGGMVFRGRFAVCSEVNGVAEYIYFGEASSVQFKGWSVSFKDGGSGALDVRFGAGAPQVTSEREVVVSEWRGES